MAKSSPQAPTPTNKARPKPRAKAKPTPSYREQFVLYEVDVGEMNLDLAGKRFKVSKVLANGRCSYLVFEMVLERLTGLEGNGQGKGSDLVDSKKDEEDEGYEVKSFHDQDDYPKKGKAFHTAASCTASANNRGPEIKALLADGDYAGALKICETTGYDHNVFYIYTNTAEWRLRGSGNTKFKYIVIPKKALLELLKKKKKDDEKEGKEPDPRTIKRSDLFELWSKKGCKTKKITKW